VNILKRLKQSLFGSSRSSTARKKKKDSPPKRTSKIKRSRKSTTKHGGGRIELKRRKEGKSSFKNVSKEKKKKKDKHLASDKRKPVMERGTSGKTAASNDWIEVGKVTHFFSQVRAGAVVVEKNEILIGDELYFKGYTTNFKQRVQSLQINRVPVNKGLPGDEVGILMKARVRQGDQVLKRL
jgi:hypothetical protein